MADRLICEISIPSMHFFGLVCFFVQSTKISLHVVPLVVHCKFRAVERSFSLDICVLSIAMCVLWANADKFLHISTFLKIRLLKIRDSTVVVVFNVYSLFSQTLYCLLVGFVRVLFLSMVLFFFAKIPLTLLAVWLLFAILDYLLRSVLFFLILPKPFNILIFVDPD